MAESLLSGIAEGVLGKIASLAVQEAIAIYGLENQLSELKETVTAIKAVLLDAEEQQAKNHRLQLWLDRLQDVLYDVDDVLDEFECEALRKQVISRYGGIKEKVRRFFSISNPLIFRAKLSDKIREIRERLSIISDEKDQFDLNARSANSDAAHTRSQEMTYSYVNKLEVVGRDIDKEKIIEMLIQPVSSKNISVIPIVGIGGLGKTTLAKLVYNDDNVNEHFELRIWVCVSRDFDLRKIIEGIIKDATHQSLGNFDLQQLQRLLRETIKDKKYLLVLDDIWTNDRGRWNELRNLLSQGASESKIIVTTRHSDVAFIMGTHPAHNLKGLSHEDSMVLFKKCAFDEKEREPCPKLLEIGNHIVEKSHGVPLLLKTLGCLLYTKREEQYWAHIRDSETWILAEAEKGIVPVLKLSYDHLPSNLKRCFAALSLFRNEVKFKNIDFAWLWMALGLISSPREKQALEDVTVEYVKELGKRSLIQEVKQYGSLLVFEMHDLVHYLASIVARNDYSMVDLDTTEISKGVRHVSFSSILSKGISNFDGVPPFLRKPTSKRLRAIIFRYKVDEIITREFIKTCLSKCKHLRILQLTNGSFEELPSSIGNLKQLRSFRLHDNKRLKELPDSICELQSLLILSLNGCSKLDKLPKNMNRLVSLRYLEVTTKQKSLQESGIQYLENLQLLDINGCKNLQVLFEGTCHLTRLEHLLIKNCGGPISVHFEKLIALNSLMIRDCKLMLTQENKSNFPLNLNVLIIAKFEQVMELLQCLVGSCTLEYLRIDDCPNFTAVPEWLPNHTHLKYIEFSRCSNLSFLPQGVRSLTALRELHVADCGELSNRCQHLTGEDWPIIAHIPQIKLDYRKVQWTED
ncbi:putative disease resistance protein RGA4 [Eucalyptus grandis]|uniref:putative disease resistance protein RGA4 n=1 Tax=Eucalyptus grandis TaxID=71139 RepID=UPI00192E8921|nr:putative disease resistance protein RGA4 [Eucalyptus grandis]